MTNLTIEELMSKLKDFEGKSLEELNIYNREMLTKGAVGLIIEENILGYTVGTLKKPDIEHLGVEIKSTPVVKNKSGYVSKERLVLGIINYCDENWNEFEQSSFWAKNKKLLITFYEYKRDIERNKFKILGSIIYEYPETDYQIILNDWKNIAKKVKSGLAHELSESDGVYLGACTKGANSSIVQNQPVSDIKAKQRAYSLKKSYMTTVFRDYVLGSKTDEKIIRDIRHIKGKSLEEFIIDCFKPYYGKTKSELITKFGLEKSKDSKAINALIIREILKISVNVEKTDEFKKAAIMSKTIRVEYDGSIKEHMSFPTFKFTEIMKQDWETSDLNEMLSETRFMFIIFKRESNTGDHKLNKVLFWSMPEEDIVECKKVWDKTIQIIDEGVVITKKVNKKLNNLPGITESAVLHVRPHARDGNDTYELPDGRQLTKQSFWLNNNYVSKIIKSK